MENIKYDEKFNSLQEWEELEEDKNYNRYVGRSLTGIDSTIIRKIVYLETEGVYIIYTKETIEEAIQRWQAMTSKQENI